MHPHGRLSLPAKPNSLKTPLAIDLCSVLTCVEQEDERLRREAGRWTREAGDDEDGMFSRSLQKRMEERVREAEQEAKVGWGRANTYFGEKHTHTHKKKKKNKQTIFAVLCVCTRGYARACVRVCVFCECVCVW
jgi:hypothetical protein